MSIPATATSERNPAEAFVFPFAAFLVLSTLEGWEQLQPFYPAVYAAKVLIVAALWWSYRHRYPAPSTQGLAWGVAVGVAGVVAWIALAHVDLLGQWSAWLPSWLVGGERVGYNPFESIGSPAGQWAFIGMRLIGLALVVPLMEEVFWRGFLLRYLVNTDFERVPVGTFTPVSFVISTLLFAAVHPELLAAIVWGAAVNLLLYRTKSLWACIAAHCVTNLLLGIYVLSTGHWNLW